VNRRPVFLITCLAFGFAFFYIPIISMIVFSFNKSRLATVWGGFSLEWYGKLFRDGQIIRAAILSLEIALTSATFATIIGTMAGIALARFRRFRGRTLFSGFVTAPLIMPEVITGISMLMLFIMMAQWIGWPGQRGFTTVTIAHITFSLTYVATIVRSRLTSADISVEEAAMDLGTRPRKVFRDITLPLSIPGIIAGGLLVFIPASGELIIPSLVGSASDPMIGRVISDEFAVVRDWPMASAVAVALLFLLVAPMMAFNHSEAKAEAKREDAP
jgi:putrescine transport system permease protein